MMKMRVVVMLKKVRMITVADEDKNMLKMSFDKYAKKIVIKIQILLQ
jgi:hypothetical protein